MARHRSHSIAFKRQVAQEYLSGETLHGLAIVPNGPNQLWVADLTYVAVKGGFVYVAIIVDRHGRRTRLTG